MTTNSVILKSTIFPEWYVSNDPLRLPHTSFIGTRIGYSLVSRDLQVRLDVKAVAYEIEG